MWFGEKTLEMDSEVADLGGQIRQIQANWYLSGDEVRPPYGLRFCLFEEA